MALKCRTALKENAPIGLTTHKTCVLPVKLEPGHTYSLGLNSMSFHGFQSEGGVALTPVVYRICHQAMTRTFRSH